MTRLINSINLPAGRDGPSYAMRERGFVFLSPAPVGRFPSTMLGIVREHTASGTEAEHRENNYVWSDSLIPLKSGTGIPNQTNHQSLTGPMV